MGAGGHADKDENKGNKRETRQANKGNDQPYSSAETPTTLHLECASARHSTRLTDKWTGEGKYEIDSPRRQFYPYRLLLESKRMDTPGNGWLIPLHTSTSRGKRRQLGLESEASPWYFSRSRLQEFMERASSRLWFHSFIMNSLQHLIRKPRH